jgi:hypothetical protein
MKYSAHIRRLGGAPTMRILGVTSNPLSDCKQWSLALQVYFSDQGILLSGPGKDGVPKEYFIKPGETLTLKAEDK